MTIVRRLAGFICCVLFVSTASADDVNNGLNAEIFGDENLTELLVRRIDPNIDWHWSGVAPQESLPADHFSIRWSGWIKAPQAGRYKLSLMGDDGYRMFLDGSEVINAWSRDSNLLHSATVDLTGEPQAIVVEYREHNRGAWITFWWQPLGVANPAIVPSDVLFSDVASARAKIKRNKIPQHGLLAAYFDVDFKRAFGRSFVYRTEAIWGDWSPVGGMPSDGAARYSGYLVPTRTGRYKFTAYADDHLRMWIDEQPVLEARFKQERGTSSAYVDLTANTAHAIVLEYRDTGRWGSYYLQWTPPDGVQSCIPCEALYPGKSSLPKSIEFGAK